MASAFGDEYSYLDNKPVTGGPGPDLTDPYIRMRLGLPPLPSDSATSAGAGAKEAGVNVQHPGSAAGFLSNNRVTPALVGGPIASSDQASVGGVMTVGANSQVVKTSQSQGANASAKPDDDNNTVKAIEDSKASSSLKSGLKDLVSKDNILSKMSNVTYSISWYIMNKEEYRDLLKNPIKKLPGSQLLVQSGGIENKFGRNEFFNVDFYMDQVKVMHLASPKGTGSAHNSLSIEFKVFEPNGITFLDRLNFASNKHCSGADGKSAPYQAQHYLMVIRFYGQDESGNPVTAEQVGNEVGSDKSSVVEKFFPMQLTKIGFRITNNITEYSCSGILPGELVGRSSATSSVQFNVELSAIDLKTMLNGTTKESDSAAPPAATAAPKKIISQGLTSALNEYEKTLVAGDVNKHANQFEIILEGDIGKARLTKPGEKVKGQMPMVYNKAALPNNITTDVDGKKFSINAGTSIVQVIDILVRSSTYITDQQTLSFDDKTGAPIINDPVQKDFQWYIITMNAVPIEFDDTRGTYAYKITYRVKPYKVENLSSPYFPKGSYVGAHKTYNHWYTGQNTEILNFEQQFDLLFYQPKPTVKIPGMTYVSNAREWERQHAVSRSPESGQGGTQGSTEPAANMAHVLYSPGDQATAKLLILGDPDWIEQAESFYNKEKQVNSEDWLPDGSVNFSARQPLFEIRYNTPTDYDLKYNPANGTSEESDQGIMPVSAFNTAKSIATGETNLPAQSQVYQAITITSLFDKGRFTQELYGTIMNFPVENKKTSVSRTQDEILLDQDAAFNGHKSDTKVTKQEVAAQTPPPNAKTNAKPVPEKPNPKPISNGSNLMENGLFKPIAATGDIEIKANSILGNVIGLEEPITLFKNIPIVPYDPTRDGVPTGNLNAPNAYQQNIIDARKRIGK